jgi:hypothetical protein
MKKILILLAVALLLLPLTLALNCNDLEGGDFHICKSIQDSDLTKEEKDLLILDIFNPDETFPSHDFIYYWNTALDIQNSPDNKYTSQDTIKNAWLSIISLMPSVIENDVLYSPDKGKLLTEYNYKVELPTKKASGDCKTKYYLEDQKEKLNIYLNGKLISHNKLASFIHNSYSDLKFKAKLTIEVKYKIKHYRKKRYCADYEDGECVEYRTRCKYKSTEYETDKLILTDTLNAKPHSPELDYSFKITEKYKGITQGVLEASNFTNLILSFRDSSYENSKYIYSLHYDVPYYVLTLKVKELEQDKINNLNIYKENNKFIFTVKNPAECKIQLFSHFNSIVKPCDLSYAPIDFEIKTDKLNHYENDTIKIEIFPKNQEIGLTYNNQTIKAKNNAEFKAVLYENKITARLNDKELNKIINVKSQENKRLLNNFFSLSFIGLMVYSAIKKYWIYSTM